MSNLKHNPVSAADVTYPMHADAQLAFPLVLPAASHERHLPLCPLRAAQQAAVHTASHTAHTTQAQLSRDVHICLEGGEGGMLVAASLSSMHPLALMGTLSCSPRANMTSEQWTAGCGTTCSAWCIGACYSATGAPVKLLVPCLLQLCGIVCTAAKQHLTLYRHRHSIAAAECLSLLANSH